MINQVNIPLSAPMKRIIKIGGYFNIINPNNQSQFDSEQAQSMAAFLMAIREINNNSTILPNYELRTVVRSGSSSFTGASSAAQFLGHQAQFSDFSDENLFISQSNIGADVVVGAGDDIQTIAMNQIFNGRKLIQVHTLAQASQLAVGASYPYKIATVPVESFQGERSSPSSTAVRCEA
jgi:hypothetical protein